MAKQIIKRKTAMAAIRADDANGNPTVHSIKYRKKDGTIGFKKRVSKSFRLLPGSGKFRGNLNLNLNHEFQFINLDLPSDADNYNFRIKIDYLIEVDGMVIDHLRWRERLPRFLFMVFLNLCVH